MTEQLHFHFSLLCIGEGNGNPLQCSCLKNPRDGRAWWTAVHGVRHDLATEQQYKKIYIYIYFLIIFHYGLPQDIEYSSLCYTTEKAMAPHSSTLAWKIPWMEEPGRLQSMGSLRVGHNWATSLSLFTFLHWRRKWQPTPVFLPGESQGWGSLVGCRLWGRTESDTTEAT